MQRGLQVEGESFTNVARYAYSILLSRETIGHALPHLGR
jgi:hypothetical protein